MNYGFVDGNKRIGFAGTYVFLRINGLLITSGATETLAFVIGLLEQGTFEKPILEEWLRASTQVAE